MTTPHLPDPTTDLEGDSVGGAPSGRPVGREGARVDIEEKKAWYIDGILAFFVALVITGLSTWQGVLAGIQLENNDGGGMRMFLSMLAFLLAMVMFSSLTIISPGDTKVIQFFGRYIGTIRRAGLLMTVPFTTKKKVSVKVRNFETNELKVNDADGNPVNIAAIVVWQVADTAKSVFAVEQYDEFVAVQSESALRHVATSHPYDYAGPGEESLRGSTERRGGGVHGRERARAPRTARRRHPRRGAQGRDGVEPARGPDQRVTGHARGQHRLAVHLSHGRA